MNLFREDNTDGYSRAELERLNDEWVIIVMINNLEEYTDEYNLMADQFSDEVANR